MRSIPRRPSAAGDRTVPDARRAASPAPPDTSAGAEDAGGAADGRGRETEPAVPADLARGGRAEERVVVTREFVNLATMQVCAVADATDTEILAVCNRENPSGTRNGWTSVIRKSRGDDDMFAGPNKVPVPCADDAARMHFLVLC